MKIGKLLLVMGMFAIPGCAKESKDQQKGPKMADGLYATLHTTKGDVKIALEMEKTPMTTCNFIGLAEGKISNTAKEQGVPFYDGVVFHRVIPNFMIQGGDPTGTGRGGPGYSFPDEISPELRHSGAGILSMANSGPGTNGSQFFITHGAQPHLDGKHTVFGSTVEGLDVIMNIKQGDKIDSITVERIGEAAENFLTTQEQFDALRGNYAEMEKKRTLEARNTVEKEIRMQYPDAIEAPEGYYYVVTEEGEGESPTNGTNINTHYTGMFMDGRVFDSSVKRGPFTFKLGAGMVIPGWDTAFLTMKTGEKRTIILPPDLAYGSSGAGGIIPPNAWLIFDVELISF